MLLLMASSWSISSVLRANDFLLFFFFLEPRFFFFLGAMLAGAAGAPELEPATVKMGFGAAIVEQPAAGARQIADKRVCCESRSRSASPALRAA